MSLVLANVYIYKANVYIYKAERTLLYAKKDVNVSCFRLLDIKWQRKRVESRYVVLPSPINQLPVNKAEVLIKSTDLGLLKFLKQCDVDLSLKKLKLDTYC